MKRVVLSLVILVLLVGAIVPGCNGDDDNGDGNGIASFSVSNLTISPTEVAPNETVIISVSVANTGGSQGSYNVVLNINGAQEEVESVTIAAGASKRSGSDCRPETNLIPIIMKVALGQQKCLSVFGDDYNTKDGTCIRDYIHVLDIAKAHILALDHLGAESSTTAYNLGNGDGYSVLEVVEETRRVTGATIPMEICPRRTGDPPKLVASSDLAKKNLGWQLEYPQLDQIIKSEWLWRRKHPTGYDY